MNSRVHAIAEEARKLPSEERMELLDLLDAAFAEDGGDGTPQEVEAAWLDEVERRAAQAERGETKSIDFDEAMARARRRIR
jgi:hypothetical protein